MLVIFQGDDTAALGKTIRLGLPPASACDGASVVFSFCGIDRSSAFVPGGWMTFDYSAAETAGFPLGISFATLYIVKDALRLTLSNYIAVKVTDCVEEAYGAFNEIPVALGLKSGFFAAILSSAIPPVSPLTMDSTDRDRRALVNSLRAALAAAPSDLPSFSSLKPAGKTPLNRPSATVDSTDSQLRTLTNCLRRILNSEKFRLAAGTGPVTSPFVFESSSDRDWRTLINEMLSVLQTP